MVLGLMLLKRFISHQQRKKKKKLEAVENKYNHIH